jgi:nucleoside-diphosphate-sugar epimerase
VTDAGGGPVVLVTGGAGFVGRALVEQLVEGGVLAAREIRVFDLAPFDGGDGRVESIAGDVRDARALARAARGADLVLHCASIVDWGRQPEDVIRAVNVGGTRNVIDACRACGVGALVMTSSLDVVYDGNPVIDGDESIPYPPHHRSIYCSSKAEAERLVLAASGQGLGTIAIRPVSIYGERDPYHVSSLIRMAVRGRIPRVGDGSSVTQHVYVGNVAHAHVLAARALLEGNGEAAGKAYFVTDSPPENFFDFLEPIVTALGYRMLPWSLSLPRGPMYAAGLALEGIARAVRPVHVFAPMVTRFAVDFVCLDYTFVSTRAERLLGYSPRYTREQALERTVAWFRAHGADDRRDGSMAP